jgi:hypothetical protein
VGTETLQKIDEFRAWLQEIAAKKAAAYLEKGSYYDVHHSKSILDYFTQADQNLEALRFLLECQ